ncbi:TIGR02556 family CRISPR-associated protein [Thermodesulfobium sp. 4217-1]|uniref:TIGR02556 family CRISPR-associated protein n=1 Tax=Thermodesulfobium sp. 4217-1 TaxID=3120013 RepID=UPI003221F245
MIEALFAIGSVLEEKSELDEFIDEIGKSDKYDLIFKIIFDYSDKNNPIFKETQYEEYSQDKKMKYFFKGRKGNQTDLTPTTRIDPKSIDKAFKKYMRFFDDFKKNNKLEPDDLNFVNKLHTEISSNLDKIKSYVENNLNNSKKSKAITLQFVDQDNMYYVGDMHVFKKPFISKENKYKDYYSKYNTQSKAKNKLCYVCGQKATEVWGFVNTYNFYTVDKRSFVTGGFDQGLAWKNYPVCPGCVEVLERAKKYIQDNLNYKFCGFDYYLIPELIYPDKSMLKTLLNKISKDFKNFTLSNDSGTTYKAEKSIIKKLSAENNLVNFNFVFYKVSQSAFNILLYIQEIAPTRLKQLVDAMYAVDDFKRDPIGIFDSMSTKNDEVKFDFSFTFIREFFPNNKFDGGFDKAFLEILNNIFIGQGIDVDFLFSRFMQKFRQIFLNSDNFFTLSIFTLKSFKILLYLEEINILIRRRFNVNESNENYESFFKHYPIFDDSTKKALFLEGVLIQRLLNIQYRDRNSKPFRKKLNGLKIDEKIAKKIFSEAINKLEEYDENYYKKLEEIIGSYLMNSDFSRYSVDELSYYFTLGMVLEKKFKKNEENLEEN